MDRSSPKSIAQSNPDIQESKVKSSNQFHYRCQTWYSYHYCSFSVIPAPIERCWIRTSYPMIIKRNWANPPGLSLGRRDRMGGGALWATEFSISSLLDLAIRHEAITYQNFHTYGWSTLEAPLYCLVREEVRRWQSKGGTLKVCILWRTGEKMEVDGENGVLYVIVDVTNLAPRHSDV